MRPNERGFALVMAMVLAVLYFGLIQLLLADSSRELAAARRFRARIVAQTLAENAAEGVAAYMVNNPKPSYDEENEQGTMSGRLQKPAGKFIIRGEGESLGLEKTKASVTLHGSIDASGKINIDFALHSQ
jgi:Tfp pilus assembly protein PilX